MFTGKRQQINHKHYNTNMAIGIIYGYYNMTKYATNSKIYYKILRYFMILLFILNTSKQEDLYSKLVVTINGGGDQQILSDSSFDLGDIEYGPFQNIPDEIYINGNIQNNLGKIAYNLEEQLNNITLIWKYPITDCSCMFYKLSNVTELDLSQFNTSLVTNMGFMFSKCISLTSLNLKNFNTKLVNDMMSMFSDCNLLNSLDLKSFDTSSVTNMWYMFGNCYSLISLNLSSFNTSLVTTMESMFDSCSSLKDLNISNFNTESLETMEGMFFECTSLTSLDLSSFDTSKVTDLNACFYNCRLLSSLDLKNFNTSLVTDMTALFYKCDSLKFLDLNNFDTSLVTDMSGMFSYCTSLTSLNIDNFDTSLVTSIYIMFYHCESLLSLNLSSFNTSLITNMESLFSSCIKLTSLNINNFDSSLVTDMSYMFYANWDLKSLNLSSFNTTRVTSMEGMFLGCKSIKMLNLSNFYTPSLTNLGQAFRGLASAISLNIDNLNTSLVTQMDSTFPYLYKLISLNLNNFDFSKLTHIQDLFTDSNPNMIMCLDKTKVSNKTAEFIEPFLNRSDCNNTCFINPEHKIIVEKNLCIEKCYLDSEYKYEYDNICYKECPNGTFNVSYYRCVDFLFCNINHTECFEYIPEGYYLYDSESYIIDIIEKMNYNSIEILYNSIEATTIYYNKSISDIFIHEDIFDDFSNEPCSDYNINYDINYFTNLCKRNISIDDVIKDILNESSNGYLYNLIFYYVYLESQDLIVFNNNVTYQITAFNNQKNNNYINTSLFDLDECEYLLKSHNGINNKNELILFKFEFFFEEYLIPIIEYQIFNINTSKFLDLSICKETKIHLDIPVSIDEKNLFKYDPSDDYYNDICYPYSTVHKTDIILKDRRNEFINNNLSLCEKNCDYKGYDISTKKAKCECYIKINFSLLSEIIINKDLLLKKFKDLKYTMNIFVVKCFERLFTKKGLITNIGSYIMLSLIFIDLLLSILFIIKGYNLFIIKIKEIVKNEESRDKKEIKFEIEKKPYPTNLILNKDKKVLDNNFISNKDITYRSNNIINVKQFENLNILTNNDNIKEKTLENNDYELNSLAYKEALEKDKRTYLQYYFSLLKIKHLLIFTFYTKTDYNSRIIKIILFFFSFSLYLTINVLFFNDSTMHKIYEEKGNVNFIYYIPQILYSTIISAVISFIIKYLSLSEKNIIEIKTTKKNKSEKAAKILKCLKIKFVIFYILCFILLLFFWYYLSCFCVIYINTQIPLIKDTITSFGLSLLYPFGINLIPGIFRISSLKESNKDRELMYKFSQYLQMI